MAQGFVCGPQATGEQQLVGNLEPVGASGLGLIKEHGAHRLDQGLLGLQAFRAGPGDQARAALERGGAEGVLLHVSSDTQFHALWRHPDLRTPGLVEDQLRAVPSVASRSLSR